MSPTTSDINQRSDVYLQWRDRRLADQLDFEASVVPLSSTLCDKDDQQNLATLCDQVERFGFSVYQWTTESENLNRDVLDLHSKLRLTSFDHGVVQQDDGLSLLTDLSDTNKGRFIPYTPRAMGWHTDGYYNRLDQTIKCFTLHCKLPALEGGALSMVDDQLVLIAMLDEAPELVADLTHQSAMTIPGNTDDLGHDRPDSNSAVFAVNADITLNTRFTTRTKNISWRTPETEAAADYMTKLIERRTDLHHTVKLKENQGIVTRNILHRREAYKDNPSAPRQMLRGRYLQSPQYQPSTVTGVS